MDWGISTTKGFSKNTEQDIMERTIDLGSYDGDLANNGGDKGEKSPPKELTWNRDPIASLSDWTIVVTSNESKKTKTYHVHKCVVGAGPRSSQYFFKLFSTSQMEECQTCTSKLDLEENAAVAFPRMLDFMYASKEVEVQVKTETAVALRHLANYFGVPTLFESVKKFIRQDIDRFNVHIYLKEAQQYHDQSIIKATIAIAGKSWRHLLLSEDGTKIRESPYMKLLSSEEQVDVMKLALLDKAKLITSPNFDFPVSPNPKPFQTGTNNEKNGFVFSNQPNAFSFSNQPNAYNSSY
mmetsp:Transcript_4984/g.6065  ORF Transcript_4984/g.6065 Transcript_4984/m.6065 type:complete len:295 (-) Transcript_4984:270-1154(-)